MKKRDICLIAATFALSASALLDPYTWFLNASDIVIRAPYWQTALGLFAAALLLVAGVLSWRKRAELATIFLTVEFSFTVAINLVYIGRDGLDRFSRGFAGEEYLSLYLLLLTFRVWIILGTHAKAYRDQSLKAHARSIDRG